MQTLKTAVVVVLLLIVLYGVYEVLTRPDPQPPEELSWLTEEGGVDSLDLKVGIGSAPGSDFADEPSFDSAGPSMPEFPGTTPRPEYGQDHSQFSAGGTSGPPAVSTPGNPPYGQKYEPYATAPPLGSPTSPGVSQQPPTSVYQTPDHSAGQRRIGSDGSAAPADPRLQENPFRNEPMPPKTAATPGPADATVALKAYERAMRDARTAIDAGRYRDALENLSVFYGSPDLSDAQHDELLGLLDPLAGEVIYSTEHRLEDPHAVGRNESLADVATQYDVPWQLLQKINGIDNPRALVPNSELKVVRGPFRAEVDIARQELTLFLGSMYAGRFPATIGSDPAPQAGTYQIRDKQQNRAYYSADGRTIAGGAPQNPYGNTWIDLGREMCIHGSASQNVDPQRGCISLSPRDAEDVFSILSIGSTVTLR